MKRKFPALLTAVLLLLTLLTACGGSGGASRSSDYYDAEMPMADEAEWDSGILQGYYGGDVSYSSSKASAPVPSPSAAAGPPANSDDDPRPQKLIRTADLSMETTTFDETAAALADLTSRLGGYFADSVSGERGGSNRWANYTIRVPVNNFQTFLDQASQLCHETHHHISQQDISERYYDTAGRLRTQNIKLQRLQALLEKAQNMEDIITIQSAISETEQQIDDLSGTLRHYDNQVDYSTIQLSLEEVYRLSNVPETPTSYGSMLGSAFVDGFRDFVEWLEDLTVSLAYATPQLVLLALILFGLYQLKRRKGWKFPRKNGAAKSSATGETSPDQEEHPPVQK